MEMNWIDVTAKKKPKYNRKKGSFGTPVLVWPYQEFKDGPLVVTVGFYGRRITDEPSFYRHGAVIEPTHWMPLPDPPKSEK